MIISRQFAVNSFPLGMPPSDCCREKTVGDKTYQLVGLEDTSQYDCLQHCVYETLSSAGLFCFAAGDLEVVCADEPMGQYQYAFLIYILSFAPFT